VSAEERRRIVEPSTPCFIILTKGDCFDPAFAFARTPYGRSVVITDNHLPGMP